MIKSTVYRRERQIGLRGGGRIMPSSHERPSAASSNPARVTRTRVGASPAVPAAMEACERHYVPDGDVEPEEE